MFIPKLPETLDDKGFQLNSVDQVLKKNGAPEFDTRDLIFIDIIWSEGK